MVPAALLSLFVLLTTLCGVHTSSHQQQHNFYTLTPMTPLGAEIHGLDLRDDTISEAVKQQLINDTNTYQLLVVRKQKTITKPRQEEIAKWYGEPLDVYRNNHPKAESQHVFRVSNDPAEGYYRVGIFGWHVDGFRKQIPHTYVTYYMESIADTGDTVFMDAYQVVEGLSPKRKKLWERLYARAYVPPNHPYVNPLIYMHPSTGRETICINMEFTLHFEEQVNATHRAVYGRKKTNEIKSQLLQETNKYQENFYQHKWQGGDLIITDNPSLLHKAHHGALQPRHRIGLRVLNRVSVAGTVRPRRRLDMLRNDTTEDDAVVAAGDPVDTAATVAGGGGKDDDAGVGVVVGTDTELDDATVEDVNDFEEVEDSVDPAANVEKEKAEADNDANDDASGKTYGTSLKEDMSVAPMEDVVIEAISDYHIRDEL